jgi:flagellar hook-associated protein 2
MATSYEDYDAASLASAMVTAERAGIDEMLSEKSTKYSTLVDGYESLQTYLEDFQDALDDYADSSSDTSFSAQTTTTSEDDYFTVESDGSAASGNYYITVEQLAQNYQAALTFTSTEATDLPTDGTLSFTVDGDSMSIDLSTLKTNSLASLVTAINNDDDNPGVTASQIQSGDNVMLLITSNETGESYAVDMSYTEGTASDASTTFSDAMTNKTILSSAQDAKILLGATNTVEITSSSNTLENVIDGLTIDLTKAQTDPDDDDPIRITVEVDSDTVEDNLQSFVDTFNTLVDNLTSLYDDGDLDGDSTVRTVISQMKNAMRNSLPDDYTLDELGLEFDSDGTLSIDSDTLEDALDADPDIITKALTDDGGLFDSIQDLLDPYTKDDGIISTMEESAQDSLDRVTERQDEWDTKMEKLYNQYLDEFTQMKVALAQLESSLSTLSSS